MPGYIKIHRKITEWEWYSDINTTRLFIHLLLTVKFKDTPYKGKIIPRGSISTTIAKLSEETALTPKEVRTACEHLVNTGEISKKTTNRETIIKVHNYDIYQDRESDEGQAKGKQRANERQANGERTEEECKEAEEGKKDNSLSEQNSDEEKPDLKPKKPKTVYAEDSDEMKLTMLLFDRMRQNNPDCKEPNFQVWCKHIDRMIRLDGRTPKDIQTIIILSQKDPFWQSNILSTEKLRAQYDQLVLKMQERKGNKQPANPTYTKSDFFDGE